MKLENFGTILIITLMLSGCITGKVISEDNIKIGFIGPLTGETAEIGVIEKNTVNIAIDEINSMGGINGRKIVVYYEDGKCAAKEAVDAAYKLINFNNVKVILSVCSSETLAIAPITEQENIILFTSYAMNPAISEAGDYVFKTSYSDADTAKIAAKTMRKYGKTMGIIYEQTSYATALKDSLVDEFDGIVYEESFPHNSIDVRTQLTKLLNEDIDFIFIDPDSTFTGLEILKQLKELNYEDQLFGNFIGSSDIIVNSPLAEGMIFIGDPTIEENSVKAHLLSEYIKAYGKPPSIEYEAVSRYDSVYLIKQAIESVGENPDKIRDYFYNLEEYNGGLGSYRFDEKGNMMGVLPEAKQIKNKKVISLTTI